MVDESRLNWALLLSVLLHALILTVLPLVRSAKNGLPAPPSLLDVDVVSLPKPAPKAVAPRSVAPESAPVPPPPAPIDKPQIVSPPDAGEEKEPANTRFLSDRNNTVKQEQIKRGEPAAGDPDTQVPAPPREAVKRAAVVPKERPAPPAPKRPEVARAPVQVAALPKLDQLLPAAGDLVREGLVAPEDTPPSRDAHAATERNDLLRHGDPWRNGSLRGGSLDFLPTIRDGDVTMLNTKADQFAPFVRRVAIRVFETFWIQLRKSVSNGLRESVEESAVVEAVMDRRGQLVALNAKDRSLNAVLATDRNLQAAAREACFDRNPPAGAEAADGYIHFLLEVQVALQASPSGVAGYRAIFGAGLL